MAELKVTLASRKLISSLSRTESSKRRPCPLGLRGRPSKRGVTPVARHRSQVARWIPSGLTSCQVPGQGVTTRADAISPAAYGASGIGEICPLTSTGGGFAVGGVSFL